jgi:opacity protein-like surface antigen
MSRKWILVSMVCACLVGTLQAQQMRLSLVGSGRMGGSMDGMGVSYALQETCGAGIRIGLLLDDSRWLELMYAWQDSEVKVDVGGLPTSLDMDVEYWHISLIQEVNASDSLIPYIVGGLGVTRFASSDAMTEFDMQFSMNAGMGVDIPLTQNVGLIVDARGYITFVDACSYLLYGQENSRLEFGSNAFLQAELNVGAYYQF